MTQQRADVKQAERLDFEEEVNMKKSRNSASRISRRAILKGGLVAAAGGTATFFGSWKHNRVWAQGGKPIKLGLTCDASG